MIDPIGEKMKRTWVLLIDGTCTKRGGFTKIANARQYVHKGKKSRGKSTKAHSFVMGLLITDTGVRIPVPRKSYYTRAYCRKHRKKYKSQQALAALMIQELRMPEDVELIVIADEYFEGTLLWNVCGELGHTWIVPVDSRRCFANERGRCVKKTLHARGKALPRTAYRETVLARGKEDTASFRRYWTRRANPKEKRRFRVAHEVREVASLGTALVVYSWKNPVYRPRRDERGETFKVLVTNAVSLTGEEVVEWYDVRWQIELYFRELKCYLGLCDYAGQDFQAFERHVDLVMIAFASQEWRRMILLKQTPSPKFEGHLKMARIPFMQTLLEEEAERNDLEYFEKCLKTKEGRTELRYLFPALRSAS
jgi:SRSO17 transposase